MPGQAEENLNSSARKDTLTLFPKVQRLYCMGELLSFSREFVFAFGTPVYQD